jgi:hypothetical protein
MSCEKPKFNKKPAGRWLSESPPWKGKKKGRLDQKLKSLYDKIKKK